MNLLVVASEKENSDAGGHNTLVALSESSTPGVGAGGEVNIEGNELFLRETDFEPWTNFQQIGTLTDGPDQSSINI